MSRQIDPVSDSYFEKLAKLLPAEFTGAYLAIISLISPDGTNENQLYLLAVSLIILMCALPFYLYKALRVTSYLQIFITTISLPIWAANSLSLLLQVEWGQLAPKIAGITLILWILIIPLFSDTGHPQQVSP